MNKIKLLIVVFLFFIYWVYNVNAAQKYNYICDNASLCYNTQLDFITNSNNYLYPVSTGSINSFSNTLDSKLLNNYINYYTTDTFIINNLCSNTSCSLNSELQDKAFTLSWILNYQNTFSIYNPGFLFFQPTKLSSYKNWKDYLFSNFTSIINTLHIWYPVWDKKNKLSDIIWNIVSYTWTTNSWFLLRNICSDITCTSSSEKNVAIWSNINYTFLSWHIKLGSNFNINWFKLSNSTVSKNLIKAWDIIDFNISFEDYLDFAKANTKYGYKIYYNNVWDPKPTISTVANLDETFSINNNTLTATSALMWTQVSNIISTNSLNSATKKVQIWIKEPIWFTKSWNKNFYFQLENKTSWYVYPIMWPVNVMPLEVLASDNVKSWSWVILTTFNPTLNSASAWFWMDKPFKVEIWLNDINNNIVSDTINWVDIKITTWSSVDIQLSKLWTTNSTWSKTLTWIKTNNNNKIVFYFRVRTSWYHDLKWFDFTLRNKVDSLHYSTPPVYYTLNGVIPDNLYNWWTLMPIYIKTPIYSSLPISCWKVVNISFTCTSDNLSWCYTLWNTSYTFSSQVDNWKTVNLSIIDNAYNWRTYSWTLNHVDTTAPIISLSKWNNNLLANNISSKYYYLANLDDLNIDFTEWTTSSCLAEVNYDVKLDWLSIKNWRLTWVNNILVLNNIFKKSWSHTLEIIATDKYWNLSSKVIYFNVYPNNNLSLNSTVSLYNIYPSWTQFANNTSVYKYLLTLKDKFDNPIYNKNIININQDCTGITWCKTINIDNTPTTSWLDALTETWYLVNKTNNSWQISFLLKSYTPWIFTPRFKIKLKKWDNKYIDTITSPPFYTSIISDNKFKKPISWSFDVSNSWSMWGAKPEIWTTQKYKINLQNIWSLWTISNWILDIQKDISIINNVWWHVFQSFQSLWKNFILFPANLYFTTRINATSNVLKAPIVSTKNLAISYTLWWQLVKYYLNDFTSTWSSMKNLWVKVIWSLQWWFKASLTWQKSNFSDISKSTTRLWLKKKIYTLKRWIKSGTTINWIKYVKWDFTINWNQTYSTLVVEDWNVIIKDNITKTLGVFVLNNNLWDKTKWNIYVNKNVTYIDAIIYADGWLISSDLNGNPYIVDNNIRVSNLQNQLVLKWSLFTRNTIGWAVLWQLWEYILPWWSRTKDFNEAMKYDLNYVRRWHVWCLDKKDNITWILTPGWGWDW